MKGNETGDLGSVTSRKMQVSINGKSSNNSRYDGSKNEQNKASLIHENSRFEGAGVRFKAKLIGVEHINEARGKVICQRSLQKLKDALKRTKGHKKRITLNISFDGMKIHEERSEQLMYHHLVHEISFISQDPVDNRSFGYIFGSPDRGHQFVAIKTEKPASEVTLVLRDLFQTVLEKKKKESTQANKDDLKRAVDKSESDIVLSTGGTVTSEAIVTDVTNTESESNNKPQKQEENPPQTFDQPPSSKQEVISQLKENSVMFDSRGLTEKEGADFTNFIRVDSSTQQPGKSPNGMEKISHATSDHNLNPSRQSRSMFYTLTELDLLYRDQLGHDKVASAANHVDMLETAQKDRAKKESRIESVSPLEVSKGSNGNKSSKSLCVNMFVPSSPSMLSHSSESSKESSSSLSWVQFVDEPTCQLKVVGQVSSYSYPSASCKSNAMSFSSNQINDVRLAVDVGERSETKHQVESSLSSGRQISSSSSPCIDESDIFVNHYILKKSEFFRHTDSMSDPAVLPECDVSEESTDYPLSFNINEPTTTKNVLISDITNTLSKHMTDKAGISVNADNSCFPLVPDELETSSVSKTTNRSTTSHLPAVTTKPTFLEQVSHPLLGEMSTVKHKKTSLFLDNQQVEILRTTVPVAVDRDRTTVPVAVDRDRTTVPVAVDRDRTTVAVAVDRDRTTVPVAVDRDRTTVPVAVDRDRTTVPVAVDRDRTTVPVAVDRDRTTVPVAVDRDRTTVPVAVDRDRTTVPVAVDRDRTTVPVAVDRDRTTVPVAVDRDRTTVPVAVDRDRTTVPVAVDRDRTTVPVAVDRDRTTVPVAVDRDRTTVPVAVDRDRTTVPVAVDRDRTTVPVAVDRDRTTVPVAVDRDRTTVPVAVDRDRTTVPVAVDRDRTTVPVAVDRDRTTVPVANNSSNRDRTTVPVAVDRDRTTVPVAVDRDRTTVPVAVDRDRTTVPVAVDRDRTTVPVAVDRDRTTVPVAVDRDRTTVPVAVDRDRTTVPIVMDKNVTTVPVAVDRDSTSVLTDVNRDRTTVPVVPDRTTVPISVYKDSTSVSIVPGRDRTIVPVPLVSDKDIATVPIVPQRSWTTVSDRDRTTVPLVSNGYSRTVCLAPDRDWIAVPPLIPDRDRTTVPLASNGYSRTGCLAPDRNWTTVPPLIPNRDRTTVTLVSDKETVPVVKDSTIVSLAPDRESIKVPIVLDKTNSTFYDKKSSTMVPKRTSLPLVPERTSIPVIPERISVPAFSQRLAAVGDSDKATLVSEEQNLPEVSFQNENLKSKELESNSISDSEMSKETFAFDLELASQFEDGKYSNVTTTTPPPLPPRPQSLNKSASLSAINGAESFSKMTNVANVYEANTPDLYHSSDLKNVCENALGIKPHYTRTNSSLSPYEGHIDSLSSFVNINSSSGVEVDKPFTSVSDPLHHSSLCLATSPSPYLFESDKSYITPMI
ncbi:uncharacterized protein LOC143250012 [Tachypleus tridentatus]|uniref:uncharacterized protein LOC143250012 n=1 Tax=Tachypleus tridentatus TaxID=6853 RepID=UPI003FD0563F